VLKGVNTGGSKEKRGEKSGGMPVLMGTPPQPLLMPIPAHSVNRLLTLLCNIPLAYVIF
jgi:hypothetical protein